MKPVDTALVEHSVPEVRPQDDLTKDVNRVVAGLKKLGDWLIQRLWPTAKFLLNAAVGVFALFVVAYVWPPPTISIQFAKVMAATGTDCVQYILTFYSPADLDNVDMTLQIPARITDYDVSPSSVGYGKAISVSTKRRTPIGPCPIPLTTGVGDDPELFVRRAGTSVLAIHRSNMPSHYGFGGPVVGTSRGINPDNTPYRADGKYRYTIFGISITKDIPFPDMQPQPQPH